MIAPTWTPPNNEARASWAEAALNTFAQRTGLSMEDDDETAIQDLLSDLMHYCRRNKYDFNELLRDGQDRYNEDICRNCGDDYDEYGDGYDGLCGNCADALQNRS